MGPTKSEKAPCYPLYIGKISNWCKQYDKYADDNRLKTQIAVIGGSLVLTVLTGGGGVITTLLEFLSVGGSTASAVGYVATGLGTFKTGMDIREIVLDECGQNDESNLLLAVLGSAMTKSILKVDKKSLQSMEKLMHKFSNRRYSNKDVMLTRSFRESIPGHPLSGSVNFYWEVAPQPFTDVISSWAYTTAFEFERLYLSKEWTTKSSFQE